ncbi:MAG: hypothetical protein EAZ98_02675, partial [Oscillatoriales cyanobacterium]
MGSQKPGFYVNICRKKRRFLEETGFFASWIIKPIALGVSLSPESRGLLTQIWDRGDIYLTQNLGLKMD